jgi:hypothetical protein
VVPPPGVEAVVVTGLVTVLGVECFEDLPLPSQREALAQERL